MLILALDPGGTTGYAIGEATDDTGQGEGIFRYIKSGEAKLTGADLWGMLDSISPTYLVAETFEFRQNTRDNVELISRDLLGVSEMWATLRNANYRTQSPAEGKSFFTDKKLRTLGMYSPGRVHARDATRHLLYFMAHKGGAKLHNRESRTRIFTVQ